MIALMLVIWYKAGNGIFGALGSIFEGSEATDPRGPVAGLQDQGSSVQLIGDEVDAGAMETLSGLQRPLMGVQTAVLGQQGRVDIEQPSGIVAGKRGGKDAHETGQDHQARAGPGYSSTWDSYPSQWAIIKLQDPKPWKPPQY